jgi:hypothetical protein
LFITEKTVSKEKHEETHMLPNFIIKTEKYDQGQQFWVPVLNMPIGSIVATGNSTITRKIIIEQKLSRVASLLLNNLEIKL